MAKIKIPRKWRERLGLKAKYDLDDLDDLLEDVVKGLVRWWRQRAKARAQHPKLDSDNRDVLANGRSSSHPAPNAQSLVKMATPAMQDQYQQALAYQAEIQRLAKQPRNELDRDRLNAVVVRVEWWVQAIVDLASRVDQFQQNELLRADRKRVPKAIADLQKRLNEEDDPLIRRELERTLASRQQQQAALDQLESNMRWAEIKIENTVSMLGTIYSQLLMGQSKGQVADYRHLLHEVNEEVAALQDYLDALTEVKFGSSSYLAG